MARQRLRGSTVQLSRLGMVPEEVDQRPAQESDALETWN
jgi:hypothetical protein